MSRMFGSLLVAPAVTCIMALSLTSYPQNIDRARIVIAILVTSWLVPVILEWTGVIGLGVLVCLVDLVDFDVPHWRHRPGF